MLKQKSTLIAAPRVSFVDPVQFASVKYDTNVLRHGGGYCSEFCGLSTAKAPEIAQRSQRQAHLLKLLLYYGDSDRDLGRSHIYLYSQTPTSFRLCRTDAVQLVGRFPFVRVRFAVAFSREGQIAGIMAQASAIRGKRHL